MKPYDSYSAKIVLTLIVGGTKLALSHVGPSGLIVRDDCNAIPACSAKLIIQIDSSVESIDIYLPHGIAGPRKRAAYI